MRFKASMDFYALQSVTTGVTCISKVCSVCAVYLTESTMEFRKKPDDCSEIEVYASFKSDLFGEYVIQSKAENTIGLIVGTKNLAHALNSATEGEGAVLKLTKKDSIPCLTMISDNLSGMNVTQDVPIKRILSRDGILNYKEPVLGEPSAHSGFPDVRVVRTCLERLEKLNKYMHIEFNSRKRQLVFRVESPVVSTRTIFGGQNISFCPALREKNANKIDVMVNIADMLGIVNFGSSNNIDECVIATVERKAIIVYLTFEDDVGTITHYIPLVDPADVIEE